MKNKKLEIPEITSLLRKNMVCVPDVIRENATGITIFGKTIYSLIFTTDVAIIENCNADAVIAVYPFTPHPSITQAILSVADIPVLCGVGGGITAGLRSANIALHAEFQGALGVVVNAPTTIETIKTIRETIDIPIILTVVSEYSDLEEKLRIGIDIINVCSGQNTAILVRNIREKYPKIPIIATGGRHNENILETIKAGANAISYTPSTCGELLKAKMEEYRNEQAHGITSE